MLTINGKKYATTQDEQIDSLFMDGGTLELIQSEKRKNEILFFTDKERMRGFFACPVTKICGQFSTKENGKLFFQFTTEQVYFWENGELIAKS